MTRLAEPHAVSLGRRHLILPDRGKTLGPRDWAAVRRALVLEASGAPDAATAVIHGLEESMGVTPAHRLAVREGPQAVHRWIAQLREGQSEQYRRVLRMAGAMRDPAPSDEVERLIRKAEMAETKAATLRRTNTRRTRKVNLQIKEHDMEARRARQTASQLREQQINDHWTTMALAETVQQDVAREGGDPASLVQSREVVTARYQTDADGFKVLDRGEPVMIEESAVRRQIIARDGLLSALRSKHINHRQYDIGMSYREAYERQSGDLGAATAESAGAGHNNDAFVLARLQRAKALQRLGMIDRAVAVNLRNEPASLQMLRAIAGEGKSLRSFGAGRALERHAKALAAALNTAGAVLGAIKEPALD